MKHRRRGGPGSADPRAWQTQPSPSWKERLRRGPGQAIRLGADPPPARPAGRPRRQPGRGRPRAYRRAFDAGRAFRPVGPQPCTPALLEPATVRRVVRGARHGRDASDRCRTTSPRSCCGCKSPSGTTRRRRWPGPTRRKRRPRPSDRDQLLRADALLAAGKAADAVAPLLKAVVAQPPKNAVAWVALTRLLQIALGKDVAAKATADRGRGKARARWTGSPADQAIGTGRRRHLPGVGRRPARPPRTSYRAATAADPGRRAGPDGASPAAGPHRPAGRTRKTTCGSRPTASAPPDRQTVGAAGTRLRRRWTEPDWYGRLNGGAGAGRAEPGRRRQPAGGRAGQSRSARGPTRYEPGRGSRAAGRLGDGPAR